VARRRHAGVPALLAFPPYWRSRRGGVPAKAVIPASNQMRKPNSLTVPTSLTAAATTPYQIITTVNACPKLPLFYKTHVNKHEIKAQQSKNSLNALKFSCFAW